MRYAHVGGLLVLFGSLVACASALRSESTYGAQLPPEIRPSYEVFSQRCSKCHSLSRPLDSGIEDDAYWAIYVRRMRLQPGSGISSRDEATVLEFLRYYARTKREERARRGAAVDASGPPRAPVPAPGLAPALGSDADASASPDGGN